jgi:hypothetical protein
MEKYNSYLNLIVNNPVNGMGSFTKNINVVYDETLTIPPLDDPRDYFGSVIRFSIPIDQIPIFVFPVNPTQNNPNVSNYVIEVNGNPANVVYTPNNNLPPPTASGGPIFFSMTDQQSQYYFVYSVQQMINMINTALNAAFVAAGSPGGTAPFYIYTPTTQLISLVVAQAFLSAAATITLNGPLKLYLSSFQYTTLSDPVTGPYSYTHVLTPTPFGQTTPFIYSEEYNAMDLWIDPRKLVITSNSLPIVGEASPVTIGPLTPNGTATSLPIITDFVLSFDNISDFSSVVTYVPTSQYRLFDMTPAGPIYRVNMNFYWQAENGFLYPLLLSPGNGITVKVGFFRKDLYLKS